MTIIVEDGTGLTTAQAYCSVEFLRAYCAERGIEFDESNDQVEAALVIAAKDWIDGEHEFNSSPFVDGQALKFPTEVDGLPNAIKTANAHAAVLHLQGLLLVDYAAQNIKGDIVSESSGLGVLSESITYKNSQTYSRRLPPSLNNLLKPYLAFTAMMTRVM